MAGAAAGIAPGAFAEYDACVLRTPFEDDFRVMWQPGGKLGEGTYATKTGGVRLCEEVATGRHFAIKCLDVNNTTKREVTYQLRCRHPAIVELYKVYCCPIRLPSDPPFGSPRTRIILVMALMEGGQLFHRIREKRKFTEEDASRIMKTIASGLAHCHRMGVAHRDLKPENLLLPSKASDESEVKIADFGFALSGPLKSPKGSGFYTAPDVVKAFQLQKQIKEGKAHPDTKYFYDLGCDLWSLGVILYILLVGYPPFNQTPKKRLRDDTRMHARILNGDYRFDGPNWECVSADAIELVKRLLQPDPSRRISAEQLLRDPWISGESAPSIELKTPGSLGRDAQEFEMAARAIRQDQRTIRGEPIEEAEFELLDFQDCMSVLEQDQKAAIAGNPQHGTHTANL